MNWNGKGTDDRENILPININFQNYFNNIEVIIAAFQWKGFTVAELFRLQNIEVQFRKFKLVFGTQSDYVL